MARRDHRALPIAALLAASCTVFNGKTLPETAVDGGDAATDAIIAPSCGCPSDVISCDDFESTLNPGWSTFEVAPTPDTSIAHCGKTSIHLHAPALASGGRFSVGLSQASFLTDGRLADGLFVRAWVFVPSTSAIATKNVGNLFELRQAADPFLGIATQIGPSVATITDWTVDPVVFADVGSPFPRDTWMCLEWHVAYGVTNGSVELWQGDGALPAATLSGAATRPSPPYASLIVGLFFSELTNAQPPVDVWLDDLVVDAKRIGCATK